MLLQLFLMFAKLSMFSFGGGYVMIPIMLKELEANGWASASELTNIVAIAGMSPGAVAINAAIGLGHKVAGYAGAAAAALGIAVPNIIIIIVVAMFFFKVYNHPVAKSVFYGLRPVITGIILFAAVSFALKNNVIAAASDQLITSGFNISLAGRHLVELKSLLIIATTFFLMARTKVHPVFIIIGAGVVGIAIF